MKRVCQAERETRRGQRQPPPSAGVCGETAGILAIKSLARRSCCVIGNSSGLGAEPGTFRTWHCLDRRGGRANKELKPAKPGKTEARGSR